ncbi:MAG: hypothetical protein ACPGPF_02540 [Pontibacterium sp.]
MNEVLVLLVAAYTGLALLLLLVLIYSRISLAIKAFFVIAVPVFYWLSYEGWQDSLGWPSHTTLPQHFLLHYGVIEEPNQELGIQGAIYLWATDLKGQTLADTPRAYQLAYTREVHSQVEEAVRQTRNGKLQLGKNASLPDPLLPQEINDGLGDKELRLEFSTLPDPALPEK